MNERMFDKKVLAESDRLADAVIAAQNESYEKEIDQIDGEILRLKPEYTKLQSVQRSHEAMQVKSKIDGLQGRKTNLFTGKAARIEQATNALLSYNRRYKPVIFRHLNETLLLLERKKFYKILKDQGRFTLLGAPIFKVESNLVDVLEAQHTIVEVLKKIRDVHLAISLSEMITLVEKAENNLMSDFRMERLSFDEIQLHGFKEYFININDLDRAEAETELPAWLGWNFQRIIQQLKSFIKSGPVPVAQ
jgi:hypothetical protein